MTQTKSLKRIAQDILCDMTVNQLVDAFDATENNYDGAIYEVRGWMMEELESRNPAAFDAWMESNESSPRRHF